MPSQDKDIIDLYPKRGIAHPTPLPTHVGQQIANPSGVRSADAQLKSSQLDNRTITCYASYLIAFVLLCFFPPEGMIMKSCTMEPIYHIYNSSCLPLLLFLKHSSLHFFQTASFFESQGNSCSRLQGMRTDVKFSCS